MKTSTISLLISFVVCASASAAITSYPWSIETTSINPEPIHILRGETVYLDATYLSQGEAMKLTDVYNVALQYRTSDMTEGTFYVAPGEVLDTDAGEIRITWTPTNETLASVYEYTIVAKSATGQLLRGIGSIRLHGTVQGDPATMPPHVYTVFDWALVTHENISDSPFADESDLLVIHQANASQDVAIANVESLVVDGVAGVESNLQAHVEAANIKNASQDEAIAAAANVEYVKDTAPGGDVTGTLGTGLTVDKIEGTDVEAGGIGKGKGLLYYESFDQLRYADLATQAELEASAALKADLIDHDALANRVTATEAGQVTITGDVTGSGTNTQVRKIQHVSIDTPESDQTSPVYDVAAGKIIWRSILASNIVYAAGTNVIADVPADSAAFYRAAFDGGYVMPWVIDGVIVAYVSTDGITIPAGTLNILNSNLTSNVRAFDGAASEPAYAFAGSPDLGWYRASVDGSYVWRFVAGGNLVMDLGIDGIEMLTGKTIILADGSEVAGQATEVDPLSIHASGTFSAWTDSGGSYTTEQVIATSPFLTNGCESIDYDSSGNMSVVLEMSTDGTNWVAFEKFITTSKVRLVATNSAPPVGSYSLSVSNVVAWSWDYPTLYNTTNDTIGQVLLVDDPLVDRAVVNLHTLNSSIAAVTPAGWALYGAVTNVDMLGHELILGDSWKMQALSDNSMWITHAGLPAITLIGDAVGLHIDAFEIVSNVVYMAVATNGVTSAPYPQYSTSLLPPDWQTITSYTGSYPVVTNGVYTLEFASQGASGFYRALHDDSDPIMTIAGDVVANSMTADDGVYTGILATVDYVDSKTISARGNLTMTGVDWSATAAGGFEPITNWTQTASQNVTLSSTGMVIDVAGWYDVDVSASFSVANNNTDPVCQIHTNGVAVPYIGWERTITSSAKGVVSGAGHIYLASGTILNTYIDTASTDTTYTFLNHSLRLTKKDN